MRLYIPTLAVLALALATPATAETIVRSQCVGHTCQTIITRGADVQPGTLRSIKVPAPLSDEERREAAEREARWSDGCRPQVVASAVDGVRRYTYAHAGCEFGFSGDR